MLRFYFPSVNILFMSLVATSLFGQTGEISGSVFDVVSEEPLPGTNLVLQGTTLGTAADASGVFKIAEVPGGSYTIHISRIGYAKQSVTIDVKSGEVLKLQFALKARLVKFDEVIVTASRENRLRSEVAVASQIISHTTMEKRSIENVGEALEGAIGLFIKNYGSTGSLKTAAIRGASASHVLVLLDGHRLNQAQGIAPDLADLPLQAVDRLEIVRGGHSALYGSDAVGGVINLLTRTVAQNEGISGGITSTLGSFQTRTASANIGQKIGSFKYFITHKYAKSEGDFDFKNLNGSTAKRKNNKFYYNDTFVKLGFSNSANSSLNGFVHFHDAKRGAPGPLQFSSELAKQKDRSWKYSLDYRQNFLNTLSFNSQIFLYKFKQNFNDPNEFFPINSEHLNNIFGFDFQSSLRVINGHTIMTGYEFRKDRIVSTNIGERSRTVHGIFFHDQIDLPVGGEQSQLSLIPAIRLDKYSGFNTELSPKLGVMLKSVKTIGLTLRGNVGRSYRVPSFNDLYWPADPFSEGNPNLIPEVGLGFDLGMAVNFQASGFWSMEINYFDTELDNLIIWSPREDGVFTPQNISEAALSGIETHLSYKGLQDILDIRANYNYLRPINNTGDGSKDLIYRPRHQFNLIVDFDLRVVNVGTMFQYIGKRFTKDDNETFMEASNVLNIHFSRRQRLGRFNFNLVVAARNVLDERTQIIDGYPIPGREFRTSFGIEF